MYVAVRFVLVFCNIPMIFDILFATRFSCVLQFICLFSVIRKKLLTQSECCSWSHWVFVLFMRLVKNHHFFLHLVTILAKYLSFLILS